MQLLVVSTLFSAKHLVPRLNAPLLHTLFKFYSDCCAHMDVIVRLRDQLADITEIVTVFHQQGEEIFSFSTF